jgi:hypothetical protein
MLWGERNPRAAGGPLSLLPPARYRLLLQAPLLLAAAAEEAAEAEAAQSLVARIPSPAGAEAAAEALRPGNKPLPPPPVARLPPPPPPPAQPLPLLPEMEVKAEAATSLPQSREDGTSPGFVYATLSR